MNKIINIVLKSWLFIMCISCSDTDNDIAIIEPNALIGLKTQKISVFDVASPINIEITTEKNVTINSAEVFENNNKKGIITISGNSGTFNSSTLLPFEFGEKKNPVGSFDLEFRYSISNGISSVRKQSLNVVKALTLTNNAAKIETYKFRDTMSAKIGYTSFTAGAVVDKVEAFWKEGAKGIYAKVEGEFLADKGEIKLEDGEYVKYGLVVGDTLYYKFTASSGILKDTAESMIAIVPQDFKEGKTVSLGSNSDSSILNLATGKILSVPNDGEKNNGEIQFVSPQGFEKTNNSNISFLKLPIPDGMDSKMYFDSFNDLFSAKETFEEGSAQTSLQVNGNDVILYKITRFMTNPNMTKDFYGVILVKEVLATNGEITQIKIDYKENTIVE